MVSKMAEAVQESILDSFTLVSKPDDGKSKLITSNIQIPGQIKGINKEFIFLKIDDESHVNLVKSLCNDHTFNIYFRMNSMTYDLQHQALKWMNSHSLFDSLVNNPKYNVDIPSVHSSANAEFGYNFR